MATSDRDRILDPDPVWPAPTTARVWDDPPEVHYPEGIEFPPYGRLNCLPRFQLAPILKPSGSVGSHVMPDGRPAIEVCACGHTWGEHRATTIYSDHPMCHRCAAEHHHRLNWWLYEDDDL